MATLYLANGTKRIIEPKNRKFFTREEMKALVGADTIEMRTHSRKLVFAFDEDANMKRDRPPVNVNGTIVYETYFGKQPYPLLGNILTGTSLELGFAE